MLNSSDSTIMDENVESKEGKALDSSGLFSVPRVAETIASDDVILEMKFEVDEPPTCSDVEKHQPSPDTENDNQLHAEIKEEIETTYPTTPILLSKLTTHTLRVVPRDMVFSNITVQSPLAPFSETSTNSVLIPQKKQIPIRQSLPERQLEITPIQMIPEFPSTHFGNQANNSTQTNSTEAFYRDATFSVVEHLNVPPTNLLANIWKKSVESQTCQELAETLTADLKRKLAEELDKAKHMLQLAENPNMEKTQFLKECDKYLDEKIANFIKSHAYLSNKFVGTQYPSDFKTFALKLYLWNPKSYRFVEQFFDLPSKDTIKKFRMPVKSGINQNLMESLKVKIEQMSMLGRQCVVCFDVMDLKNKLYYDTRLDYLCGLEEIDGVVGEKLANYALLISIRGLYTRWKQPVSFALVSEKRTHPDIQRWLRKTLEVLFDMGLKIKALVTNSDQGFLEVPEESYFVVKELKIYHILDFPDLLKIARNELMENDFYIGSDVVKWEYILSVYDTDKAQELALLPNLTENHVRPDATSRNYVDIAKQLFNSNIAAAMHMYVVSGLQNEEAKASVQFMKRMKNLCDILYSRRLVNAYRSTSAQNKFLKETLEYFKALHVKDEHGNVTESKFVTGVIYTIESITRLAADLKKCNVKYLLTKNISKDFTQDYFKDIKEPQTAIEFTRRFRRLYLSNLLNNTKKTATCDEMMSTLAKISEYVKEDMNKNEDTDKNKGLSIGISDYKIDWPSNEYIAGYLLWKCLEKLTCENIVKNICDYYKFEEQTSDVLVKTFSFYNANNVNNLCNVRPPIQMLEFVNKMEERFNEYVIRPNKDNLNFGWNLYNIIEQDSLKMPCKCFPNQFLRMLYVRLKIYSSVKQYNKININKR